MLDVLIVGSGPAGLSAAIYTSRAGLSTIVLEGALSGGLVRTTEKIDNYLGMPEIAGLEMAEIFKKHAVSFGAKIESGVVDSIVRFPASDDSIEHFRTVTIDGNSYDSRTVIFASGSTPRKMGIPGEDLTGVSYCATCDGIFFEGDPVVVVGGGESAAEEALYLAQITSSVDVLVRGDSWKASQAAVDRLTANPNVTVHLSTVIDEVLGNDEVEGVKLRDGRTIDANGVFVAIGQIPNSATAGGHVTLLEDGFIKCSKTPGFFVAGDISNPAYRQVIVAAGDGAKAGIDATEWILTR